MNFCINCGLRLHQATHFCLNCGKKNSAKSSELIPSSPTAEQKRSKLKLQLPKKQAYLYYLIGGFGALFLVCHLTLSYMASPDRKVKAFEEVLLQGDAQALYDSLAIEQNVAGSPEQLLAFLVSEDIHSAIDNLANTANQAAHTKSDQHWGNELFKSGNLLTIRHKKLLFYDTIELAPFIVEMKLEVPQESTFTLLDKEYAAENDQVVDIGTFIPGDYDISYDAHFTFVPVRGSSTLSVTPADGKRQSVKLENVVKGETIKLRSQYDGILYINGKSTNYYVSEIGSLTPVSFNEKLKLKVVTMDTNGNEMHSNELPMTSNELVFHFPAIEGRKKKQWSMDVLKEQVKTLFDYFQSGDDKH